MAAKLPKFEDTRCLALAQQNQHSPQFINKNGDTKYLPVKPYQVHIPTLSGKYKFEELGLLRITDHEASGVHLAGGHVGDCVVLVQCKQSCQLLRW